MTYITIKLNDLQREGYAKGDIFDLKMDQIKDVESDPEPKMEPVDDPKTGASYSTTQERWYVNVKYESGSIKLWSDGKARSTYHADQLRRAWLDGEKAELTL